MYKRKYSSNSKLTILITILVFSVLASVITFKISKSYFQKVYTNTSEKTIWNEDAMFNRSKNILRAKKSISPGEKADKSKFEIVQIPDKLVSDESISSLDELENMRIKNQLVVNQFVMKNDLIPSSAWYDNEDRLVEHVFQQGTIPASVSIGSIVDIKLFKQNDLDPVVISKVVVINKKENIITFYLNSIEQEYIKEASTEGVLFITQYLDINQTPSDITYTTDFN